MVRESGKDRHGIGHPHESRNCGSNLTKCTNRRIPAGRQNAMQVWRTDARLLRKSLKANPRIHEITEHYASCGCIAVDNGTHRLAVILASHGRVFTKIAKNTLFIIYCKSHNHFPFLDL